MPPFRLLATPPNLLFRAFACPWFRAAGTGEAAAAAAAAATEARAGGEATHGQPSPFSLDPDLSFIEMATEHRRVVDFLCQACHRVSRKAPPRVPNREGGKNHARQHACTFYSRGVVDICNVALGPLLYGGYMKRSAL